MIGNSQGSRVVGLENLPVGVFLVVSTLWPFCGGTGFTNLKKTLLGPRPKRPGNVKVDNHIFRAATPPKTNGWRAPKERFGKGKSL